MSSSQRVNAPRTSRAPLINWSSSESESDSSTDTSVAETTPSMAEAFQHLYRLEQQQVEEDKQKAAPVPDEYIATPQSAAPTEADVQAEVSALKRAGDRLRAAASQRSMEQGHWIIHKKPKTRPGSSNLSTEVIVVDDDSDSSDDEMQHSSKPTKKRRITPEVVTRPGVPVCPNPPPPPEDQVSVHATPIETPAVSFGVSVTSPNMETAIRQVIAHLSTFLKDKQ